MSLCGLPGQHPDGRPLGGNASRCIKGFFARWSQSIENSRWVLPEISRSKPFPLVRPHNGSTAPLSPHPKCTNCLMLKQLDASTSSHWCSIRMWAGESQDRKPIRS
jgi:hypothetical protein